MTTGTTTSLLGPGSRATTLIRAGLGFAVVAASVATDRAVTLFPLGIDVMIPLAAADRWLAGATTYLPDGFTDPNILPPFLYPPFILPLVAPLTSLPEEAVRFAATLVALITAIAVARRLAVGWALIPFVLLWEPMFGAIWGGNVQIVLFAAFVVTFWRAPGRHDLRPEPRALDPPGVVTPRIGWYAATVASVKATQLQVWLAIARRSPKAAILGTLPWAVLVLVTLPIVGIPLYLDWISQVSRASDPTWPAMGPSLLRYLPTSVVVGLTVASFVAALWIRGRDTGAWIGLLMLLVAPNMHDFQGLFLLPAMLRIRREFALVAAFLTATATAQGWWLGIAIVVVGMLVGLRWPEMYEPTMEVQPAAPQGVSPAPSSGRGPA